MPRSGTTLTEQIVSSHPQVFGTGELRDLHRISRRPVAGDSLFPRNLARLTPQDLANWGADYVAGLSTRSPGRVTDKMPDNFLLVGLIHLMLPNAKIIHVKRHPLDTCVSCFCKLFRQGQDQSSDLFELGRYYRDYARLMQHWREVLPLGTFCEVEYEQLVAETEQQAQRLIGYCGLAWDDACLAFYAQRRPVRTASITQVRQPIYTSSLERWRRFESFLDPLKEGLGEELLRNKQSSSHGR